MDAAMATKRILMEHSRRNELGKLSYARIGLLSRASPDVAVRSGTGKVTASDRPMEIWYNRRVDKFRFIDFT